MSNLIKIDNLSKHYSLSKNTIKAIDNVSLKIDKKEYVALMGTSGSGKSTLMNIIGCLDTPSKGSYLLNNQDVSKLSDNRLAEIRNLEVGFVFQTFNLLSRINALDNVALPLIYAGYAKDERIKLAKKALKEVGLSDRIFHKPNELSGGQRQRVAIARALVNNPSIILADEPTGNLDSKNSGEIMKILKKIHLKGNTIVLVTHENDIAKNANRIIQLKDGQILTDEKNNEDLYKERR
tara:strand:- start:512 stop:1222 length:711 start_codon:yes stop_codon:yes gene_type:complete